jgi:hypothetical protein
MEAKNNILGRFPCLQRAGSLQAGYKASELRVKGTDYLECAVKVLSDLENANIIGRVYPQYEDEIVKEIGDNVAAGHAFYKALDTWESPIAWHHNQMHNLKVQSTMTNESHCSYHGWQTDHTSNKCPCVRYHKCMCYKCHKYGHIQ